MSHIEAPNYTQIPNVIFDKWMQILSSSSFKVLLCMCRKIFGWHKTSDYISTSQIVRCTGLTKKTVLASIESLIEYGLVLKSKHSDAKGNHPNEFKLNIHKPDDEIYQTPERPPGNFGRDSGKITPGVVEKLHQGGGVKITPTKERPSTKERLTKRSSYSDSQKCSSEQHVDFSFSSESGAFEGISEKDLADWKQAYEHIDVHKEIIKAQEWIKANPSKAKKKLWRKFLLGWFTRANDKAENQAAYRSNSDAKGYSRKNSRLAFDGEGEDTEWKPKKFELSDLD